MLATNKNKIALLGAVGLVIATILYLGLLAGGVLAMTRQGSGPVNAGTSSQGASKGGNSPDVILYDQYDNTTSDSSESFDSSVPASYNDFTADDFVVPAGQAWHVTQVEVAADLHSGQDPVGLVNVFFYLNANGVPGLLLYSESLISPSSGSTNPHLVIPLPNPVDLSQGHWWVSVQGHGSGHDWWWVDRSVSSNNPAAWENPGGGWNYGCQSWGIRATCFPPLYHNFDQVFLIRGTVNGAATHTPTKTPTRTPTRTATRTPRPTQTPGGPTATPQPTSCPVQFADVLPGSTFYDYIRCLACRGIVNGYADGTFQPNNNVTRGQLAKIVSNAANFTDQPVGQQFQDEPAGSTFYTYTYRLVTRSVMSGYQCGGEGEPCVAPGNLPYFRPNNNATRGQISKIDAKAAGFNDAPSGQQFEDVVPGSTFYTYTYQLVSRSIMSGYACGGEGEPCNPPGNLPYFRPTNNATRGQTSKIVANTFLPDCQTP